MRRLIGAAGVIVFLVLLIAGSEGATPTGYTLQDIYDYLNSGIAATEGGHGLQPPSGSIPGDARFKSTADIYNDVKAKFDQCDASITDVRLGKKYFSAQSASWGVRTGKGAFRNGLLKTGLPDCYRLYDDGYYSAGMAFNYTDNGDGTVSDNVTGLMWAKDGAGAGCYNGSVILAWVSAVGWAEGLTFAGYSDWRLPNIRELESLRFLDARPVNPCINKTYFPNTATSAYMSSTPARGGYRALNEGGYTMITDNPNRVRAVRGGESEYSPYNFLVQIGSIYVVKGVNNAGTYNNGTITHIDAVSWAAGLDYAGYSSGWRLPTKDELTQICAEKDRLGGYEEVVCWTSTLLWAPSDYYTVKFDYSCAIGFAAEHLPRNVRVVRDGI